MAEESDLEKTESPSPRKIEKAREEVFTALTAESFSAQVYQQKVDALHSLHGRQAQVLSAAVKEMAKSLSQTERRALAERLRRMPENRPPQGGGPRRPPPLPPEGEDSGMPPPPAR